MDVLASLAAGLIAAWGLALAIPTRRVVAGFEPIRADNRWVIAPRRRAARSPPGFDRAVGPATDVYPPITFRKGTPSTLYVPPTNQAAWTRPRWCAGACGRLETTAHQPYAKVDVYVGEAGERGHPARIELKIFLGSTTRLHLVSDVDGSPARLYADLPSRGARQFSEGDLVTVRVDPAFVRAFPS